MQNFLVALVLVLLAGGGYYLYTAPEPTPSNTERDRSSNSMPTGMMEDGTEPVAPTNPSPTPRGVVEIETDASASAGTGVPSTGASATAEATLKEITVTSTGMAFNQKTLAVKKGDRVRITYTNGGGTHDLRIEGYNVGTKVMQGGVSETFEFVADKAGTFEYYCSVGSHRQAGMKGTLTVTE